MKCFVEKCNCELKVSIIEQDWIRLICDNEHYWTYSRTIIDGETLQFVNYLY